MLTRNRSYTYMSMGFAENTCKYTLFFHSDKKMLQFRKKTKENKGAKSLVVRSLYVTCTILVR